ncbi:MAG TPA: type IV pilin protein [Burkholderiales bacterium]|jgi:type IV pilus assembly protein PilE
MQHTKGFTLLELMITVVVIAILAGIALPSYNDYVLRAKFSEATGNLADLRVKMEQFYADNRRYSTTAGGGVCGIPGVPDGNTPSASDVRYFTYRCASTNPAANPAGDQAFTLFADGVAAQGLGGLHFTVTESNVKATVIDGGSDMAGKGYAANAACWVRKKPSDC